MPAERPVDVARVVAEIEAEVARKRAAGEYPEELLSRLHAEFAIPEDSEPPEALTLLLSARPLASTRLGGPLIVFGKRAVRRLLSWYIHPITEDQTRFNTAIVREVRSLERRLGWLETPWAGPGDPLLRPASFPADVDAERAAALTPLLEQAPPAPILVLGPSPALVAALSARGRVVHVAAAAAGGGVAGTGAGRPAHPLDALLVGTGGSLGAVVLAGVLPRLSPAELLAALPAAARRLRPGGLIAADAPDPGHPLAPPDASTIDVTMRRRLAPDTLSLLMEGAGLEPLHSVGVGELAGAAPWHALVGRRPARRVGGGGGSRAPGP